MKIIINCSIFFLLFSCITSKSKEGALSVYVIEYERFRTLNDSLFYLKYQNSSFENRKRIKEKLLQKKKYSLLIRDNESLFRNIIKLNNSQLRNNSNIRYYQSQFDLYTNFQEKKYLLVNENNSESYIQDSITSLEWKIYPDTVQYVLGRKVNMAKAPGLEENTVVTAWFDEKLPYYHGPYLYNSLPGTILKIEIEFNGKENDFINNSYFLATKIGSTTINKKLLPNTKRKVPLTKKEWEGRKK